MPSHTQTVRLRLTAAQLLECLPGAIFEVECYMRSDGEEAELVDWDALEYADWEMGVKAKWRTLEQYAAGAADPAMWELED